MIFKTADKKSVVKAIISEKAFEDSARAIKSLTRGSSKSEKDIFVTMLPSIHLIFRSVFKTCLASYKFSMRLIKDKIILITAVSLFAAAGIIITVIVYRKKRRSSDTQIDEHTGIGNEKYYTYAFEQLLSRQSKNLYALIYLAADIDG